MPRVIRTTVLALLASSGPALLQAQAFEGVVNWQMTSDKGPMQMVQSYKGTQVRSEMAAQGQAMILLMDATSSNMIMIMPSQKMYTTMDMKKMAAEVQGVKHDSAGKITATGGKETVAGRGCDDYLVGAKQDIEVCATKGMGFFQIASGGGPMGDRGSMGGMRDVAGMVSNPAYAKMFADGFFPLKVSKVSDGKKSVIMEATKIEPGPVDASLFKVPDGYTEMKM
jgi:hypothetical protein